jgi:hypothetical protein
MYALGLSAAGNAQLNGYPGLARSMDCAAQWLYGVSENKLRSTPAIRKINSDPRHYLNTTCATLDSRPA